MPLGVVEPTRACKTVLIEEMLMVVWLATAFMIAGCVLETIGHVLWRLGERRDENDL